MISDSLSLTNTDKFDDMNLSGAIVLVKPSVVLTATCLSRSHSRAPACLTLQLGRQSWFMKAAGPSHSCAQFLRHEYMTLKSLMPGRSMVASSSLVSSAIQPTSSGILSCFFLRGQKRNYFFQEGTMVDLGVGAVSVNPISDGFR